MNVKVILNIDVPITERLYFKNVGGVIWYTPRKAFAPQEWAQMLINIYGGYVAGG